MIYLFICAQMDSSNLTAHPSLLNWIFASFFETNAARAHYLLENKQSEVGCSSSIFFFGVFDLSKHLFSNFF